MSKHSLRILLVEDHPFQLIATQILLNNQGYFLLTPRPHGSRSHGRDGTQSRALRPHPV